MPTRDTDTRFMTLVDLPMVRRLMERNTVLDSEMILTRDAYEPHRTLIPGLLLQRDLYTLIARADGQQVIGQFRLKPETPHAQIMYVAPELEPDDDDTAWLTILDAMAREAGRHGAHALLAEVEESSPLFETLRTTGFAVYARQEIWQLGLQGQSGHLEHTLTSLIANNYPTLPLRVATADDENGILALIASTVPGLVQQFALPATEMPGWVYRVDDRVEAYFACSEGKTGFYIMPYLHPDVLSDAHVLIASVLRMLPNPGRRPIYMCVRRYQDWLLGILDRLGFVPYLQQALMVKHIAAGVRHASFVSLQHVLEHATGIAKPPIHRLMGELADPLIGQTAACFMAVTAAMLLANYITP